MLSNPNLDAADTGVDPSTGKYLTKKERIGIFKRRKIKTSSVFGKKNLVKSGRGGALKKLPLIGAVVGAAFQISRLIKNDDPNIDENRKFSEEKTKKTRGTWRNPAEPSRNLRGTLRNLPSKGKP